MRALPRLLLPLAACLSLAACDPDAPDTRTPTTARTASASTAGYDTLIVGARIVDGTGNPWYRGDIGLRGGRIVAIGKLDKTGAKRVIDAADRVAAPGFIDLMGQDTNVYVNDRVAAESRLRQGIATHVSGEGESHAPQNLHTQPEPVQMGGEKLRWSSFDDYFRILEKKKLPINVAYNIGAAQVRRVVIGDENRAPTPAEMKAMEALVDQGMRQGATGLSTALIYPPGTYASTDELIALARVVARHGGIYSTHMRNESGQLLQAIDESILIGERAGLPVHIYHLKAAGQENWPLMAKAIERIAAARQRGVQVTADIYPYIRNGLHLVSLIPPHHFDQGADIFLPTLSDPAVRKAIRAEFEDRTAPWENWYRHAGNDWDNILITDAGRWPDQGVAGLSVAAAAKRAGRDPWDMMFDLVQAGGVQVAPETMDEAQKRLALRQPWMMVETDTPPINPAKAKSTHPRAFGAFPRVLAKYSREEKVLTLEDAVRRMTSMQASLLGLHDRGLIAAGMAADLVLFDPDKIQDRATFERPLQYATGVDYLLINGVPVIDDGAITGALPGRVLRHGSADIAVVTP